MGKTYDSLIQHLFLFFVFVFKKPLNLKTATKLIFKIQMKGEGVYKLNL